MVEFLQIDRGEVMRYLGYRDQQIDFELDELISESISECMQTAMPRYCYNIFDIEADASNQTIHFSGTSLTVSGSDIYNHLCGAKQCAILAATLGAAYDNAIRIREKISMTEALILDACGTEYIEKVCDTVEREIQQQAEQNGLFQNFRFSPGYGDLPLACQTELIKVLDTSRKIGLTCTPSCIMLPRKSVTALIGLSDTPYSQKKISCASCTMAGSCRFRKEGTTCGR